MLSIFFVGNVSASIYTNNTSKNNFVLNPAMMNYQSNVMAIGGADFRINNNVLIPAYSVSQEQETEIPYSKVKNKDKISYYIVQPGDNVGIIAKKFGVSTKTIIWENNLNSKGFLKLKQKLTILPVSGLRHTIKKGDTLKGIAKKYSVEDIQKIREFNDLKDDFLKIGDKIIIPGGKKEIKNTISKSSYSSHSKKTNSDYIWIKTSSGKTVKHKAWSPTKRIRYTKTDYGYFTHPMPGSIRTQGLHGHNAIDMAAPIGTPILAAHSGIITTSYKYGYGGGYGKHVVINHQDGIETLYAHMLKVIVNKGQKVIKGQIIGYEGSTGRSTGPHLHFEVHGRSNPF